MKAIFIDATNKKVEFIDVPDSVSGICKAIGCDLFTMASELDNRDVLYVAEEAIGQPCFFAPEICDEPLMGNGLIVGGDDPDENMTDAKSTEIKVYFVTVEDIADGVCKAIKDRIQREKSKWN